MAKKRGTWIIVIIIILLLAVVAGYFIFINKKCVEKENKCCRGTSCNVFGLKCNEGYNEIFKGCDKQCKPIMECEQTPLPSECAEENEQFSRVYTDQYPSKCCQGLIEWEAGFDTRISIGDVCYETGLLAGSPVGVCINCGNGKCDQRENPCNCLADCRAKGKSTYSNTEDFCTRGYSQYCSNDQANNSVLCGVC